MTNDTFDYHVLFKKGTARQPGGLIASWEASHQPLRAVVWSPEDTMWVFAPGPAALRLYDDRFQDTFETIDRQTAEQIALEHLGSPLPDEETLRQICLDGERDGTIWGPRRS
jgi:hypothetical protein